MTPPWYSSWPRQPTGSWQPTSITGPSSGTGSASRETTASPPAPSAANRTVSPHQSATSATRRRPPRSRPPPSSTSRNGFATYFLYQPIELHDIEQQEHDWWPWPECPQIVIRFGYGPPGASSPRREGTATLDRQAEAADHIRR